MHVACVAAGTLAQRAAGQRLIAIPIVSDLGVLLWRWRGRRAKRPPALGQFLLPGAIGEEAVVADAMKAGREHVQQHAADELGRRQRHGLVAGGAVAAVIAGRRGRTTRWRSRVVTRSSCGAPSGSAAAAGPVTWSGSRSTAPSSSRPGTRDIECSRGSRRTHERSGGVTMATSNSAIGSSRPGPCGRSHDCISIRIAAWATRTARPSRSASRADGYSSPGPDGRRWSAKSRSTARRSASSGRIPAWRSRPSPHVSGAESASFSPEMRILFFSHYSAGEQCAGGSPVCELQALGRGRPRRHGGHLRSEPPAGRSLSRLPEPPSAGPADGRRSRRAGGNVPRRQRGGVEARGELVLVPRDGDPVRTGRAPARRDHRHVAAAFLRVDGLAGESVPPPPAAAGDPGPVAGVGQRRGSAPLASAPAPDRLDGPGGVPSGGAHRHRGLPFPSGATGRCPGPHRRGHERRRPRPVPSAAGGPGGRSPARCDGALRGHLLRDDRPGPRA